MTEIEFEGLLQSAFKNNSDVPDEINQKLKKKLYKKLKYKRILKSIPVSVAACFVIGIAVASVMFNSGENKIGDINPIVVNDTQEAVKMNMARGAAKESLDINNTLLEALDNKVEKVMKVTSEVKKYIADNPDYDFYDGFVGLSGNEKCYYEESGELVVIFDSGSIAPEEHGEIFINVGIVE